MSLILNDAKLRCLNSAETFAQSANATSPIRKKVSGPEILPPKELHEVRIIRDAERAGPGIVRRTVDGGDRSRGCLT
jgi:hypothetical protein